MPLYDFNCGTCGHRFEEMAKVEEKAIPCLACQKIATRELPATHSFSTIVVQHPATRLNRAGNQHLRDAQFRPKEKISVSVPANLKKT